MQPLLGGFDPGFEPAAGFILIGFHVAAALLARGDEVVGIDNLNEYYSVALKRAQLAQLEAQPGFSFHEADVGDTEAMTEVIRRYNGTEGVIHLAAQAGVRYSLENPYAYVHSNLMGQVVMLEAARRLDRRRCFAYASSSSIYCDNKSLSTSRIGSMIRSRFMPRQSAHASSRLEPIAISLQFPQMACGLYTTPGGRPDVAAYLFADAIMSGRPINVFNEGKMERDFTYIDDIVAGTIAALERPPVGAVPHKVYHLGNHRPEPLLRFIELLEKALGRGAVNECCQMQPGDVPSSFAEIDACRRDLGFEPPTPIEVGVPRFVEWYKEYTERRL